MPASLTLNTERRNNKDLVLVAAGEIDLSNIDAFNQALSTATTEAASSGAQLVVDLSSVEYLDSGAINALASCAHEIKLIANPLLMSALTVSGVAELVTIEPAPDK